MQLIHRLVERAFGRDGFAVTRAGMVAAARAAHNQHSFDLIAAVSPDFRVLETAARVATEFNRPFVACFDDPHGHRDQRGFFPAEPERQRQLLSQAAVVVFASPLTQVRYQQAGLLDGVRSTTLLDCFLETDEEPSILADRTSSEPAPAAHQPDDVRPFRLVHLGNLPAWRPLETLFQAINDSPRLQQYPLLIEIYGFLYPEARRRLRENPLLAAHVRVHQEVNLARSHSLASTADGLLVVIGPRHLDNIPSKFFEYLCHPKPVIVVGPPGNPLEQIVDDHEFGLFADVNSSQTIAMALEQLILSRSGAANRLLPDRATRECPVSMYGSGAASKRWAETFSMALGSPVS
jgi:hypothetical protein